MGAQASKPESGESTSPTHNKQGDDEGSRVAKIEEEDEPDEW